MHAPLHPFGVQLQIYALRCKHGKHFRQATRPELRRVTVEERPKLKPKSADRSRKTDIEIDDEIDNTIKQRRCERRLLHYLQHTFRRRQVGSGQRLRLRVLLLLLP